MAVKCHSTNTISSVVVSPRPLNIQRAERRKAHIAALLLQQTSVPLARVLGSCAPTTSAARAPVPTASPLFEALSTSWCPNPWCKAIARLCQAQLGGLVSWTCRWKDAEDRSFRTSKRTLCPLTPVPSILWKDRVQCFWEDSRVIWTRDSG